jgi:hypothetical protein
MWRLYGVAKFAGKTSWILTLADLDRDILSAFAAPSLPSLDIFETSVAIAKVEL